MVKAGPHSVFSGINGVICGGNVKLRNPIARITS